MRWVALGSPLGSQYMSEDGRFRISEHEAMRGVRYFLAYRSGDRVPLANCSTLQEAQHHCERDAEMMAAAA